MTTRLEKLMAYGFPRAVGHTWAEINGVKNSPKAVLIVANRQHNLSIDLPKEQIISIYDMEEKLAGKRCPIVVDHNALSTLVSECVYIYKQQIDDLREENTELKDRILRTQRVLEAS